MDERFNQQPLSQGDVASAHGVRAWLMDATNIAAALEDSDENPDFSHGDPTDETQAIITLLHPDTAKGLMIAFVRDGDDISAVWTPVDLSHFDEVPDTVPEEWLDGS